MRARLAEFEAARFHVANPKLATDKMIQRHAARDHIPPGAAESEIDIELAP